MRLRDFAFPTETDFFELLRTQSETVLDASLYLSQMITKFDQIEKRRDQIKECEHAGDINARNLYTKLNISFITPFDREDISKLTASYDDVVDFIYAVANRIYLYKIEEATPPMLEFASLITESVKELNKTLATLSKVDAKKIEQGCAMVSALENKADNLLNESVATLFNMSDPIRIIKLKEIYEYMEIVTDKCKEVADAFREIGIKYS
ncbi:MAG: DUF47 family protein [Thaumarchaeota archaeon]|nr:DUF47 family protein [Nitrososphaerota archaeon]